MFSSLLPTGWSPQNAGEQILAALLQEGGIGEPDVDGIIVTGYGRIPFNKAYRAVTEISCHARGVAAVCPEARTIIDIGGQDSKVISINEKGNVLDFNMNDKCAAGTGKFLQVMANTLGMDVEELATAEDPAKTVSISSMCTVFAKSEIISLLARDVSTGGIIASPVCGQTGYRSGPPFGYQGKSDFYRRSGKKCRRAQGTARRAWLPHLYPGKLPVYRCTRSGTAGSRQVT